MHRIRMLLLLSLVFLPLASSVQPMIEGFDLGDVTLGQDTFQARAAASGLEYLLQLDPDRLLWVFRSNSGLPTPGEPFTGSWEDPHCELRGHFVGHYLSALALTVSATGNRTLEARLDAYVEALAEVQQALNEDGYLSAFPSEHFDRVEALQQVWAPYYVIHKIMAGLLDAHLLAGSGKALTMVQAMAAYFLKRIDAVVEAKGEEHWQQVLNCEFGGMNEVAYRLYRTSRNPNHLRLARRFDKSAFFDPMAANQDVLAGHHANTHLAQVVGFAERAESTADPEARDAVTNFFGMVTGPHSYATGGSSDKEFWFDAGVLGESITKHFDAMETQETCTQYNVRKCVAWLRTKRSEGLEKASRFLKTLCH